MPLTWGFSGCGHRADGVRGARPGSRSRAGHVAVVRQPYRTEVRELRGGNLYGYQCRARLAGAAGAGRSLIAYCLAVCS
jgi:hypothetical protein